MSLGFSLGIIRALDLVAVPVTVQDGSAIFHYEGVLTAVFQDLREDTVIQWTQVSGLPVAFTSPLNEAVLTFTSNDLDKKEFVCCTNPGTDAEICSKAEFYHFPVSWAEGTKLVTSDDFPGAGSNPDYPGAEAFEYNAFYAMQPIDRTLDGYDLVTKVLGNISQFSGVAQDYRETVFTFNMTDEALKSIRKIEFYEDIGAGWTLIRTILGNNSTILRIPHSETPLKITFTLERYGYSYEVDLYPDAKTSPGATEFVDVAPVIPCNVEVNTLLSSMYNMTLPADTITSGTQLIGGGTAYTLIQSLKEYASFDVIELGSAPIVVGVVLSTTLQTSTNVT